MSSGPIGPDGIEASREADWAKKRARELTNVPGPHRFAIQKLLEEPPFLVDDETFMNGVELFFAARTRSSRRKFFQTLFPGLHPHFADAWEAAGERTYQLGHARLPFRAPDRSALHARMRARWFVAACGALRGLDVDTEWLVRNAGYLEHQWRDVNWGGWLLGTALRSPAGDELRSVAREVLQGGAEAGIISRDLIIGLVNSDEPKDWELVGSTLLAAKRQEGLRQAVLEAVDESNPDAFTHMLDLIVEHRLDRFSSATRAVNVWLGTEWGAAGGAHDLLQKLQSLLADPSAVEEAIEHGSGEDVYLALWTLAYRDAEAAVARARPLVEDSDIERRFAALLLILRTGLLPESLQVVSERLIAGTESDPRVIMLMVQFLGGLTFLSAQEELFDAVARLFEVAPAKKKKLEPVLWPWLTYHHDRREVGGALRALVRGNAERMIPYASALEAYDCAAVIHDLAGSGFRWETGKRIPMVRKKLSPAGRRLIVELSGDARSTVHTAAFEALEPLPVEPDEVEKLVSVLHRKAATLRVGAIRRLLKLRDRDALEVAERLLSDSHEKRRAAGAEILAEMIDAGRSVERAEAMRARSSEGKSGESPPGGAVDEGRAAIDPDDPFLGLLPSASLSITPELEVRGATIETRGAKSALKEVAQLLVDHSDHEIEVSHGGGRERILLGAAGFRLPRPPAGASAEDARASLPLADVWLDWLEARGGALDPDGHDFVRAWAWAGRGQSYLELLPAPFRRTRNWSIEGGLKRILEWMLALDPGSNPDLLLVDYFEDGLAGAKATAGEKKDEGGPAYGPGGRLARRYRAAQDFFRHFPWLATPAAVRRLGVLELLAISRGQHGHYNGPPLARFASAFDAGEVSADDLIWFLLQPRSFEGVWGASAGFGPVDQVTRLRVPSEIADRPALLAVVERVRDRIVEVEIQRGDLPGPASGPAKRVRHAGGADVLFRLATALGRDKLVRQFEWGETSRAGSLSRLIALTRPEPQDTAERFAELVAQAALKPTRLLELAMFAPQWAPHIEGAVDRPGLSDAAWWIHAHTKQSAYWRDQDFRAEWLSEVSERTELLAEDLEEGAVDVRWFNDVIAAVGEDGWSELARPAKYASNGGGHKRAQLFGDAMLGRVTEADLRPRINEKRHQDAVRALGLLPLAAEAELRTEQTLTRYEWLHQFLKQSRKFGSQRQASERRAVEIGLQNLARAAGYRDPQRLGWAMERAALSDLEEGPVVVARDDVSVTLSIDSAGDPELSVQRGERTLKSVPKALSKDVEVKALKARIKELRSQRSRMRESLEVSMVRGHELDGRELQSFFGHPMLRPRIERLVLVGEGDVIGYPTEGGLALRDAEGAVRPVGATETVRIAHPADFVERGDWHTWLKECFAAERIQPFKQLFREVYPKTADELDLDIARRYGGQQVNPSQALALFKGRRWVAAPEEGVKKTFHDERIVATVWFQEHFYTPAEVDGLTLDGISFHRRGQVGGALTVSDVPDRLFSEVMRDLDLVVSVAHAGGVDPEASASTMEMRARLVEETADLLSLPNIRIDGHHVHIEGKRAGYSVHLGSANASVLPGRALVIVAVHSQYRGRLFLPFADDDPKTAEVLSKCLLLARDDEIKDPAILRQIEV